MSNPGDVNYDSDGTPEYQFVNTPGQDPNQQAFSQGMTNNAMQSGSQFTGKINANVQQQSNLMGNQSQQDPQSQALSAKASQMYGSQVNSMMRQASMAGTNMQMQVQTQNTSQLAANYANTQAKAQMNYQQISFQRSAAIQQENYKRTLYGQLFGGAGAIGGAAIANMSSPTEATPSQTTGAMGNFNFGSGSAAPTSYNSPNFGTID